MSATVHVSPGGYTPYGNHREFWFSKEHEQLLSGPYETGKTLCALNKLNLLLAMNPGARALMVRQTYKSLVQSAVITYEQKVLPFPPGHTKCPVQKIGGTKPELYNYPNGSVLALGGMDKPEKVLSSEWDYIYIPQAEELRLEAYEQLMGRATGRAGNVPIPMVMLDANPGPPNHWLLSRPLHHIKTRHQDNPSLFDPITGEMTSQGELSMKTLRSMTGLRYKRGYLGEWAGAEGAVYEDWDPSTHVIDPFVIPPDWRKIRAIDFGFRNAFVCLWGAVNHDGILFIYRQLYMTERTVRRHSETIKLFREGYEATVADHDAEDRATLHENGIRSRPAKKEIKRGIERVQERLKVRGNGKPGLFVMRDSLLEVDKDLEMSHKPTCLEDEMLSYIYPEGIDGKVVKELPVDNNNHAQDALRYMIMYLDESGGRGGTR